MPLLAVRVNDDLTLDAGWVEEVSDPQGFTRIITPPQKSMFFQLIDKTDKSHTLQVWKDDNLS